MSETGLIDLLFFSKAYLEQVLAQAKIKVSTTSPTWEPLRAYERRVTNIMAKTKGSLHESLTWCLLTPQSGTASKSRGRPAGKPRELATSDEESGEQSGEEIAPQGPASQPPQPRAAYRTRSRSAELDAMSASEDGKSEAGSRGKGKKRRSTASPHLSQPRSASRGVRATARSTASVSSRSARSSPEGEVTPKASRKRARVARHEEEEGGGMEHEGGEGDGVTEGDETVPNAEQAASSSPARPPSRASSRASSAGAPEDFRVRRKRARH